MPGQLPKKFLLPCLWFGVEIAITREWSSDRVIVEYHHEKRPKTHRRGRCKVIYPHPGGLLRFLRLKAALSGVRDLFLT